MNWIERPVAEIAPRWSRGRRRYNSASSRGLPASIHTMTRNDLTDVSITTGEEFEAALAAIIENAIHEGIDVRGAWEFETRGSTHNWDVEVVELAKQGGAEDDSPMGED